MRCWQILMYQYGMRTAPDSFGIIRHYYDFYDLDYLMSWLERNFKPSKYNKLSECTPAQIGDLLMMRWRVIDYYYRELKQGDWTHWKLFKADNKTSLFNSSRVGNDSPPINFGLLLSEPTNPQNFGVEYFQYQATPEERNYRDQYSVKSLQVQHAIRISQHLDVLTEAQTRGMEQQRPFEDLLLDDTEFAITYNASENPAKEDVQHMEDFRDELRKGSLVVVNATLPIQEIKDDFEAWLMQTREMLGIDPTKKPATTKQFKQRVITKKILQLIDFHMILCPFHGDETSLAELMRILKISPNRFSENDWGERFNEALELETIERICRMERELQTKLIPPQDPTQPKT